MKIIDEISTPSGKVTREYVHLKEMVVFCHGFGVKRDSRGLFTDIASNLPSEMGYVLFDFNSVVLEGGVEHVHLRGYHEQMDVLESILTTLHPKTEKIHLVGHSMGSMTISLLAPEVNGSVILLAPPVASSSGRSYFNSYEGAMRDKGNVLVVPRKDGTVTHVHDSFWDEAEKYFPPDVYINYSHKHPLTVIEAEHEDILKHLENYSLLDSPQINRTQLPGNHNFDPPHRNRLVEEVLNLLK